MYLSDMAFKNKDKLKFIIMAFADKENDEDDMNIKIDHLREEIVNKLEKNT